MKTVLSSLALLITLCLLAVPSMLSAQTMMQDSRDPGVIYVHGDSLSQAFFEGDEWTMTFSGVDTAGIHHKYPVSMTLVSPSYDTNDTYQISDVDSLQMYRRAAVLQDGIFEFTLDYFDYIDSITCDTILCLKRSILSSGLPLPYDGQRMVCNYYLDPLPAGLTASLVRLEYTSTSVLMHMNTRDLALSHYYRDIHFIAYPNCDSPDLQSQSPRRQRRMGRRRNSTARTEQTTAKSWYKLFTFDFASNPEISQKLWLIDASVGATVDLKFEATYRITMVSDTRYLPFKFPQFSFRNTLSGTLGAEGKLDLDLGLKVPDLFKDNEDEDDEDDDDDEELYSTNVSILGINDFFEELSEVGYKMDDISAKLALKVNAFVSMQTSFASTWDIKIPSSNFFTYNNDESNFQCYFGIGGSLEVIAKLGIAGHMGGTELIPAISADAGFALGGGIDGNFRPLDIKLETPTVEHLNACYDEYSEQGVHLFKETACGMHFKWSRGLFAENEEEEDNEDLINWHVGTESSYTDPDKETWPLLPAIPELDSHEEEMNLNEIQGNDRPCNLTIAYRGSYAYDPTFAIWLYQDGDNDSPVQKLVFNKPYEFQEHHSTYDEFLLGTPSYKEWSGQKTALLYRGSRYDFYNVYDRGFGVVMAPEAYASIRVPYVANLLEEAASPDSWNEDMNITYSPEYMAVTDNRLGVHSVDMAIEYWSPGQLSDRYTEWQPVTETLQVSRNMRFYATELGYNMPIYYRAAYRIDGDIVAASETKCFITPPDPYCPTALDPVFHGAESATLYGQCSSTLQSAIANHEVHSIVFQYYHDGDGVKVADDAQVNMDGTFQKDIDITPELTYHFRPVVALNDGITNHQPVEWKQFCYRLFDDYVLTPSLTTIQVSTVMNDESLLGANKFYLQVATSEAAFKDDDSQLKQFECKIDPVSHTMEGTIDGLTSGKDYYFRYVATYNNDTKVLFRSNNIQHARTLTFADLVSDISAKEITYTSMKLDASVDMGMEQDLQNNTIKAVFMIAGHSTEYEAHYTGAGHLECTLTGLTPDKTYKVFIRISEVPEFNTPYDTKTFSFKTPGVVSVDKPEVQKGGGECILTGHVQDGYDHPQSAVYYSTNQTEIKKAWRGKEYDEDVVTVLDVHGALQATLTGLTRGVTYYGYLCITTSGGQTYRSDIFTIVVPNPYDMTIEAEADPDDGTIINFRVMLSDEGYELVKAYDNECYVCCTDGFDYTYSNDHPHSGKLVFTAGSGRVLSGRVRGLTPATSYSVIAQLRLNDGSEPIETVMNGTVTTSATAPFAMTLQVNPNEDDGTQMTVVVTLPESGYNQIKDQSNTCLVTCSEAWSDNPAIIYSDTQSFTATSGNTLTFHFEGLDISTTYSFQSDLFVEGWDEDKFSEEVIGTTSDVDPNLIVDARKRNEK